MRAPALLSPFSYSHIPSVTNVHLSTTGLQTAEAIPGQSAAARIAVLARDTWRAEGPRAFYKGLTPRVLRVAPGQAVVFAVYERVRRIVEGVRKE